MEIEGLESGCIGKQNFLLHFLLHLLLQHAINPRGDEKMLRESEEIELKEKLNEKLEKEVVAFLNSDHGGNLYVGVADDGKIVGLQNIDQVELEIKDRIKNNISPNPIGLFDIITRKEGGKEFIQIIISSGNMKPYYLRQKGMRPEGTYFRIGTSAEKMSEAMIFWFIGSLLFYDGTFYGLKLSIDSIL